MGDLTAFLAARLNEDAVSATMREIHTYECESVPPPDGGYTFPCDCGVPERLFREVAAKRAILEKHAKCSCPETLWLAAVYSDHPDYDPAWDPGLGRACPECSAPAGEDCRGFGRCPAR